MLIMQSPFYHAYHFRCLVPQLSSQMTINVQHKVQLEGTFSFPNASYLWVLTSVTLCCIQIHEHIVHLVT